MDEQVDGRPWARAAIILYIVFLAAVALLHVLVPDMNPVRWYISDYATSRFGFIMNGAFLALGFGVASAALSLLHHSPFPRRPWATIVLLSVAGIMAASLALFESDPPGGPASSEGAVHDQLAGFFFLALMIAMLVFSVRLWRAGRLRGSYWALPVLALLAPPLIVAVFALLEPIGLVGLGQRVYILVLVSWLIMLASGLHGRLFTARSAP